jgi:type I restriction enzyme, R subunit
VPKNGNIFFTIFQTFMTGRDAEGNPAPNFGDYPPDFFDFIIIDECHRGGANDESNWRGIMEYFQPAVQLGLTATPKRKHNADTYAYFGEPVYIYSLKEGINDGYLTPFKVRQIATTWMTMSTRPMTRSSRARSRRAGATPRMTSTASSRSRSASTTG